MKKIFLVSALTVAASFGMAQSFQEGFNFGPAGWGTTTTYGNVPGGETLTFSTGAWHARNESSPVGLTGWFNNPAAVFPTLQGAGQLNANFNSSTGANDINSFFMSPVRTFKNGDVIRFSTRTATGSTFPDRLFLVWSGAGASVDPADFTTTLVSVNPTLAAGGYPETYTQFEVTISGLSGPTSGRFAFNYNVTTGGPSGANSDFIGIDNVQYVADGIEPGPPADAPPPTAPSAIDLGTVDTATSPITVSVPILAAAEIKWYKFTLSGNVSASGATWLDIWTTIDGSDEDTEIGVYDSTGVLKGTDDDDGDAFFSFLSYGIGSGNQFGTGALSNGRDLDLTAGTYYLAVGEWQTTYNPTGFSVTSAAPGTLGVFNLLLASNLPPAANQTLSGTLNLNDTVFGGSFTRTITGTVKQGATTVGTITVSGINSSSTAFSGSIPASATGAATIEWDGSSFLLRKTNITLTGSNLAVGTVNMQNGDVDTSGEVDAADIDEVIANFGSSSDINSDVDVSGEVDAADIDIVIANFGGTDD